MKQTLTMHRPALGLLLAAAALPVTPLLAQDAAPPTDPPVVAVTPPPVATPPPEETPVYDATPPPLATTPPAVTAPAPVAAAPPVRQASPARTTRNVRPTASTARAQAPVRAAAPAAAAPVAEPAAPAPLAASPVPPAAEPEVLPVETAAPAEAISSGGATWPWLVAGAVLLMIAALALFARRRRRRAYDEVYEAPVAAAAEPEIAAAPLAFAAAAPVEAFAATSAAARPWLDLLMRPVRAGVGDDDAVVEFELTVDNKGTAPARDVRISTWMLAAGSTEKSEMERLLIEPPADSQLREVTIDAGAGKRIEAAVALSKAGLEDAILPVVVADARYRLPDGSEGRTSASFAVGVPVDGDLAHFDVEHPSGMHEDVEARARGELQRT
jgi:LPXTG-motif cell wall-anchored protein